MLTSFIVDTVVLTTDVVQVFSPSTSAVSRSLELVYIHGMSSVVLTAHSLETDSPVSLLVLNCTDVTLEADAVPRLRTLVVREAARVQVGVLPRDHLWATVLESIRELRISAESLTAEYSVSVGRVESLTVEAADGKACAENTQLKFLLFNSKVMYEELNR